MRNAFARVLTAAAGSDPRVVLLSGDIGNRLFDDYKLHFPDRFINCGAAEANMMSVAAGLALSSFRPVVYTIAPFVTTRCLEQIKIDVCHHNVPVLIVGVGSGLAYAALGPTHHSFEDIASLRALPNMTVVCPGDAREVDFAVRAALGHPGPCYLRLGKKGEPIVHEDEPASALGKGIVLRHGRDIAIISTGTMLATAMRVAGLLEDRGTSAQVASMHTVKPLDENLLADYAARFKLVVTLEEHGLMGGFGSAVAEWWADQGITRSRLHRMGVADRFLDVGGDRQYACTFFGLEPEQIVDSIFMAIPLGV